MCQPLSEKRHCHWSTGWDLNFTASFHFHLVSSAHILDCQTLKSLPVGQLELVWQAGSELYLPDVPGRVS